MTEAPYVSFRFITIIAIIAFVCCLPFPSFVKKKAVH